MQRLNKLKYYVLDTFQTSTNTFLLLVHQPPTINAEFLMAKRTLCKQFIATHNGVTISQCFVIPAAIPVRTAVSGLILPPGTVGCFLTLFLAS